MHAQVNPKEIIIHLANEMNDIQLTEIANFMQFLRFKNLDDTVGLIKASESSLDFWDNEEDSVWDNV